MPRRSSHIAAVWQELERSVEAIQAGITAVLDSNPESIEGQALLEQLARMTAVQRQVIQELKREYLVQRPASQ